MSDEWVMVPREPTAVQLIDGAYEVPDPISHRDELTKAEREITRLSAEVDALKRTHDEAMKRSHEVTQEMARQFETEVEALKLQGAAAELVHRETATTVLVQMAEVEALRADSERLTGERDVAIEMLAYWCVAVDQNGTGWDDWDEHYKDAMYRPCPIRELLDKEINAARAAQGDKA